MSALDNAHATESAQRIRAWLKVRQTNKPQWGDILEVSYPGSAELRISDMEALIAEYERVTTETEWEYGCRDETDGYVASVGAPWMTREYAERVSANASSVIGVRRRKAGPWEPVQAERSTT